MSSVIIARDLSKSYGRILAVDSLNLDIKEGEIFGLLGPNGAGKSTTILMMLGLSEPTKGTAVVCGYDATRSPKEVKKIVGFMPDNVGFYNNRTGFDNLLLIARLNMIPEKEAKIEAGLLAEKVGLEKVIHRKVSTYSRGMKQRLGLAEVLIKKPKIIILDEPTLGIDPTGIREFLELIATLSKEEKMTVLLSSHHLYQVQSICDRVGIFVGGKLLAQGNLQSLSKNLFGADTYSLELIIEEQEQKFEYIKNILTEEIDSVSRVELIEGKIIVQSHSDITGDLSSLMCQQGFRLLHLSSKTYGLDEIYQKYFEGVK